MPEKNADDRVRLARDALAAVVADARARGLRPAQRPAGPAAASRQAGDDRVGLAADATDAGPTTAVDPALTGNADLSDAVIPRSGAVSANRRRPARRPGFPAQQRNDDPQPLARAIDGLLTAEGWTLAAATGSVFSRWAEIVGVDLATHTSPQSLTDGELVVTADSTAWATQVRLLAAQLVRRLNAELGDGTVVRVKVTGPVTSTRKPGEWRVRGSRGPRDTYG